MPARSPSLLICGSVILDPDHAYLSRIRSSIIYNPLLADLRDAVIELPELWYLLVEREPSLERVSAALALQNLAEWIECGNSPLPLAGRTSRNAQLAVLTVLSHISEYMIYLSSHNMSEEDGCGNLDPHTSILKGVRDGGIQGLCVGLLSAIALACSPTSTDVAKYGAVAVRLALCVGALVDLDEIELSEPTVCICTRWPQGEGHSGEEVLKAVLDSYPQSYVGVRLDVRSVNITAPKGVAMSLMRDLEERGAVAKQIDLQGRYHHPAHEAVFQRLIDLCASLDMLQFPQHNHPLVPLRRNDSGQVVTDQTPLHEVALQCILVKRIDWYTTITKSVADMAQGISAPSVDSKTRVLALGPVDCIPRSVLAMTPLQVIRPMTDAAFHHGYPDDSIAIIGVSCRFPGSENPQQFWEDIRTKRVNSCLEAAGSFDSAFFRKPPREAEHMDPQHRLGLHLAYEALQSGGYFSPSSSGTDNVGCYIGMSSCDYEDNVNSHPPTAYSFTGTARAFSSGRISHFFGLTGPSMVIDTACSSSGVAIHTACRAIQSGECSMALAGGINLMGPEARSHHNLAAASFLSPTGQCRPFDADADGYRRSEGGGFVLLKRLSAAVADHDCILGVLAASAVNNTKGSRSITLPSAESQSHLYRLVLQTAGLHPQQVSYVEAHGTGTQKGDPIEWQSIQNVFGGRDRTGLPSLHLGSVKGNIGHCEAASGVAALVKVLLMLQNCQIPPQANFSVLNPAISSLEEANMDIPVCLEPWTAPFRAAMVNNYGASGTNAAMLVCQPPLAPPEPIMSASQLHQYPILITSHSKSSLREYCRTLLEFVETQRCVPGDSLLPSIAFHLAQRQNESYGHRVAFSARSVDELKVQLHSRAHSNDADSKAPRPQGRPKPVVLVFAGQTGRQAFLSRESYLSSSLLQHHLDRCDRILQTMGLHSLFPRIFETEPIDDLVDLHCMHFSLQYSVAASWIRAGLEIKMVVGHSLGQLTALCVSGVLSLGDALKMISGRASLIQNKWGSERGCMLSVEADTPTVEAIAQSILGTGKVEIACYNAALHHVIVGSEAAIAAFKEVARSRNVSVKRLLVTHGFHSAMMDCIIPEYQQLIQELTLHPPNIPIEPCSEFGGSWDNITPELIARQSREPVYFNDAICRVEQNLGPCIWLEAGSGSAGVTMASRALRNRGTDNFSSHSFSSILLQGENPMRSLVDTTISLWNAGIRVQFWLYHASERRRFVPLELPQYPFKKSDHWLPVLQKHKDSEPASQSQKAMQEAPKLVSLAGPTDAETTEFFINQHSDDYSTFVRGRTVFGQVLAPSSVYIEAATRALALLPMHASASSSSPPTVEVTQLRMHAPFGLDLQKCLRLTLRKQTGSSWCFFVESHAINGSDNKGRKLQASGTISWQGQACASLGPRRPLLRRLYDRCEELREDHSASTVQGLFVRKLLERVASYDNSYLGIQSITSKGLEAVANIAMPAVMSQACAETAFGPPIFDNFLLVAELHASSLGDLADDVYICNSINAVIPHVHPGDREPKFEGPWMVFSCLNQENDKTIVCDIFVFSAHRNILLLEIIGASLTRVPISSLQKALESMNGIQQIQGQTARDAVLTLVTDADIDLPNSEAHLLRTGGNLHAGISGSHPTSGPILSRAASSDDEEGSLALSSTQPPSSASSVTSDHDQQSTALLSLLAEHLSCSQGIPPDTRLGDIGLDSLVAIQLQSDVERVFGKRLSLATIDENLTLSDLCRKVLNHDLASGRGSNVLPDTAHKSKPDASLLDGQNYHSSHVTPIMETTPSSQRPTPFITQARLEFAQIKQETSSFAQMTGFAGFFADVYQKQTSLVLAYILEAFSTLGCDLSALQAGDPLPPLHYTPKYQKLVSRFHNILEDAGLISVLEGQSIHFRTAEPLPQCGPSADIYRELLNEWPKYRPDHQLLNVTGPRLSDCLSGRADPLRLLFQDAASVGLLEDVYVSSPMFATGNKMLGKFLHRVLSRLSGTERLRVLEIGAGTGATTRNAMDQLLASNVDFIYTFTDISPALVTSARKKFRALYNGRGQQSNMEFTVLDIEKLPPANMLQSYDLIISSNCIHATQDLGQTCVNIEKLLRTDGGVLCLLELTRPLGWLDCVFGLLDGWWRFNDDRTYALADEYKWKSTLLDTGFFQVDWTDDGSRESQQFRLIMAWR
ncbi:polyketide synthase [Fusarium austroafricanum]|uniref:Polyketide synthase n=1 Tax=Fusarium austroafricanum TaxID=2364996 RepID=A0A8H4KCN0_9HYPO|nr:polyketide synthase [Fusarium austroafricanum]